MGMRSGNRGLDYYFISCASRSVLVVYFCGCPDSAWRMVYAQLLAGMVSGEKGVLPVRFFVFKLPKFLSELICKLQGGE